ncbi:MAG: hypothetical protein AAF570_03305, partial [Bacteroidota bacterium]
PVYARAEGEYVYEFARKYIKPTTVDHNDVLYAPLDRARKVHGQTFGDPYAASFLLTEITGANFIDRDLDGPDRDDFGGYVRFSYQQKYGSHDKNSCAGAADWFRWRVPYTGLQYDRNELSDPQDDSGSMWSGLREVYYLERVETKSHAALFYTSDREDGLEAPSGALAATTRPADLSPSVKADLKRSQRLDSIKLHALNSDGSLGELLQTVRLEYDYSLMKGQPNSSVAGGGKLTLKRVWSDYRGTRNAHIHPHEFHYEYPSTDYPTPYDHFENYADVDRNGSKDLLENPDYAAQDVDRWGQYQLDGDSRKDSLLSYVNQRPEKAFDPAAWHLKRIVLPSRGEIHVQYEQDDYGWVQNRKATVMAPLKTITEVTGTGTQELYLDLAWLGWEDNAANRENLRRVLQRDFVDRGKKMYYRFLYALSGTNPQLDKCNSDYIEGYSSVREVGVDGNGLYVKLGAFSDPNIHPRKACLNHVRFQKQGKLVATGDCDRTDEVEFGGENPVDAFMAVLAHMGQVMHSGALNCLEMNEGLSFLKIPVLEDKKGGGVRVKRMLTYDSGIEAGLENLQGTEYVYKDEKGRSSGVATNEPTAGGEENALVDVLELRDNRNVPQFLIHGKDRQEFEGPYGKALLPGASVGYARVVTKNIHEGKTSPGFSIHSFYTLRDFPFDGVYEGLNGQRGFSHTAIARKGLRLEGFGIRRLVRSQGYAFVQHDMHGKNHSTGTYPGNYDPDAQLPPPVSFSRYEYDPLGTPVPLISDVTGSLTEGHPGREIEVYQEGRKMEEVDVSLRFQADANVGFPIPLAIPFASGLMYPGLHKHFILKTHVTTKVVHLRSNLRRIVSTTDGITTTSEQIAFDAATGQPRIVRTWDDFHGIPHADSLHKGWLTDYSLPAFRAYTDLRPAARNQSLTLPVTPDVNIDKYFDGTTHRIEFVPTTGDACGTISLLCPGDLVRVADAPFDDTATEGVYQVDAFEGNVVTLLPVSHFPTGTAASVISVRVEVLRSGHTNQIGLSRGSISTYGPQEAPVGKALPADREHYVDALNLALAGASGEYAPGPAGAPSSLDGTCQSLDESPIYVSGGAGGYTVTYGLSGCQQSFPPGKFDLDSTTLELIFRPDAAPCFPIAATCVDFCPDENPGFTMDGVLAANAQVLTDKWPLSPALTDHYALDPDGTRNAFETGARGKWRPKRGHNYRTSTRTLADASELVFSSTGVMDDFTLFNFDAPARVDTLKWLYTTTSEAYSPHGELLGTRNVLGIHSRTQMGYHDQVPIMSVANAAEGTSGFESFEVNYGDGGLEFEQGWVPSGGDVLLETETAHTGQQSLELVAHADGFGLAVAQVDLPEVRVDAQVQAAGLVYRLWLQCPEDPTVDLDLEFGSVTADFEQVARVGEWRLMSVTLSDLAGIPLGGVTPRLHYVASSTDPVFIDDLCFLPTEAQLNAIVYDP